MKSLGLPEPFTALLLTFSLVLCLAPYFSGGDFGIFKIPQFTDSARKWLKIIGPILFLFFVMLFVPLIPLKTPITSGNANRIDTQKQAQLHIARAHDLYNQAKFDDAIKECDIALGLEPENRVAIDLKNHINVTMEILKQKQ
jgi:hypothetical protein